MGFCGPRNLRRTMFAVLDPSQPVDGYSYDNILPGTTYLFDEVPFGSADNIRSGDLIYLKNPQV